MTLANVAVANSCYLGNRWTSNSAIDASRDPWQRLVRATECNGKQIDMGVLKIGDPQVPKTTGFDKLHIEQTSMLIMPCPKAENSISTAWLGQTGRRLFHVPTLMNLQGRASINANTSQQEQSYLYLKTREFLG